MNYQFILWLVPLACVLHAWEERSGDWKGWTEKAFGLRLASWDVFYATSGTLILAAMVGALIGWRLPALALTIPAVLVIHALSLHVLPSLAQRRLAPGTVTAVLLYLPVTVWALYGAYLDGALGPHVVVISVLLGVLYSLRLETYVFTW